MVPSASPRFPRGDMEKPGHRIGVAGLDRLRLALGDIRIHGRGERCESLGQRLERGHLGIREA